MLTPVTPNPIAASTTIKSHGSESRTAPGHNAVEAQALPQTAGHSLGIGLDAGTIFANVNAETATAGNRTILQTLAFAVAAQLNIARRDDETMDAFFLRIAAAIDNMTPDERAATELRTGLKMLKIQLPELSAALKQPEGALAARLSAIAEAPLATPQKTAAAAATTSYLQEAPGVSRAAETLAMVTQARNNSEGSGIFSSSPPPAAPEKLPADARSLQSQLKSLFEPGVAETRTEIAQKIEQQKVLILGALDDLLEPAIGQATTGPQPRAVSEKTPAPSQPGEAADRPTTTEPSLQQAGSEASEPLEAEHDTIESRPTETKQSDAKPAPANRADPKQTNVNLAEHGQTQTGSVTRSQPQARAAEAKGGQALTTAAGGVPVEEQSPDGIERRADPAERRTEPRAAGLLTAQNNNYPTAALRLRAIAQELVREKIDARPSATHGEDGADHRVQTMLALKGIAEVITTMPSKATEFLMSPQRVADIKAKEARNNTAAATSADADSLAGSDAPARKESAAVRHSIPATPLGGREMDEADAAADRPDAREAQAPAKNSEPEKATAGLAKAISSGLDTVPFAYAALQPAKEEFKADALEEKSRREDEGDERDGDNPEDEEARRERLARQATDDLLRPEQENEPDVRITRDSSQADRAYALYQRMAGF